MTKFTVVFLSVLAVSGAGSWRENPRVVASGPRRCMNDGAVHRHTPPQHANIDRARVAAVVNFTNAHRRRVWPSRAGGSFRGINASTRPFVRNALTTSSVNPEPRSSMELRECGLHKYGAGKLFIHPLRDRTAEVGG